MLALRAPGSNRHEHASAIGIHRSRSRSRIGPGLTRCSASTATQVRDIVGIALAASVRVDGHVGRLERQRADQLGERLGGRRHDGRMERRPDLDRFVRQPRALEVAAAVATPTLVPEITVCSGRCGLRPIHPPCLRWRFRPARRSACTTAMVPRSRPVAASIMKRPRASETISSSSSVMTPAA